MADKEDDRAFKIYRDLGRIDAQLENKVGRDELQVGHSRTIELISESEKRSSDLVAATAAGIRRDMKSIEERVRENGEQASEAFDELSEVKRELNDQRATLATIRENTDAMANKKINWAEWFRWGLILIAILGAAMTQDYRALLSFLR